jgi:hypothetical protein
MRLAERAVQAQRLRLILEMVVAAALAKLLEQAVQAL